VSIPRKTECRSFFRRSFAKLNYSSPVPPFPSFVFTLAATGTTGKKLKLDKAEGI
jgi:hypothetical protein